MLHKAIIQGKIEFGTEKSYSQALKMYDYRSENYHKSDTLFLSEEIFIPEGLILIIPRFVKQVFDKTYRNTIALLEYCTQFGLSGEIDAWLMDEGKILKYDHIEPDSDKVVVQRFLKGKALVGQRGEEENALKLLSKAIEKYDRHAQAYQKRAKVNLILDRSHDAMRDYSKSLGIDDTNPFAYYGRAKVHEMNGEKELAIADLEDALKRSVALQPVYWKARRAKGKIHYDLKQWELAAFDFKLFSNRKFEKGNPNIIWLRYVLYYYGKVLIELGQYEDAIAKLTKAQTLKQSSTPIEDADILRELGIAKWKAGKNGYIKDWNDAAEMGDKLAARLIKENS